MLYTILKSLPQNSEVVVSCTLTCHFVYALICVPCICPHHDSSSIVLTHKKLVVLWSLLSIHGYSRSRTFFGIWDVGDGGVGWNRTEREIEEGREELCQRGRLRLKWQAMSAVSFEDRAKKRKTKIALPIHIRYLPMCKPLWTLILYIRMYVIPSFC